MNSSISIVHRNRIVIVIIVIGGRAAASSSEAGDDDVANDTSKNSTYSVCALLHKKLGIDNKLNYGGYNATILTEQ